MQSYFNYILFTEIKVCFTMPYFRNITTDTHIYIHKYP
jgi:hypothetical protein